MPFCTGGFSCRGLFSGNRTGRFGLGAFCCAVGGGLGFDGNVGLLLRNALLSQRPEGQSGEQRYDYDGRGHKCAAGACGLSLGVGLLLCISVAARQVTSLVCSYIELVLVGKVLGFGKTVARQQLAILLPAMLPTLEGLGRRIHIASPPRIVGQLDWLHKAVMDQFDPVAAGALFGAQQETIL